MSFKDHYSLYVWHKWIRFKKKSMFILNILNITYGYQNNAFIWQPTQLSEAWNQLFHFVGQHGASRMLAFLKNFMMKNVVVKRHLTKESLVTSYFSWTLCVPLRNHFLLFCFYKGHVNTYADKNTPGCGSCSMYKNCVNLHGTHAFTSAQ